METIEKQSLQIISSNIKARGRDAYHVLVDDPAKHNHEGNNQQRNLHTGSYGYANGKIHLVFDCHSHCSGMLSGVANNRQQNYSRQ